MVSSLFERRRVEDAAAPVTEGDDRATDGDAAGLTTIEGRLVIDRQLTRGLLNRHEMAANVDDRAGDAGAHRFMILGEGGGGKRAGERCGA